MVARPGAIPISPRRRAAASATRRRSAAAAAAPSITVARPTPPASCVDCFDERHYSTEEARVRGCRWRNERASASAVMTAGVTFAVLAGLGSFPADKLVEVAALSACGFLLIEQGQL